jgi:hypothetical protein
VNVETRGEGDDGEQQHEDQFEDYHHLGNMSQSFLGINLGFAGKLALQPHTFYHHNNYRLSTNHMSRVFFAALK